MPDGVDSYRSRARKCAHFRSDSRTSATVANAFVNRAITAGCVSIIADDIESADAVMMASPFWDWAFLLAAHDRIVTTHPALDKGQKKDLKLKALRGVELVDGVARLCAMNLLLHGVGPTGAEGEPPVTVDDSLRADPGTRFDVVLTNPPFGKKSSVLVARVTVSGRRPPSVRGPSVRSPQLPTP